MENIFHKNDAEGRALLVRILSCLVCKFATLKVHIAKQIEEETEALISKNYRTAKIDDDDDP